jgi:dihydroneopterin triphosphate diphosphatase
MISNAHARAPFQVLVLPYIEDRATGLLQFAVFQRRDVDVPYWQGISGGGEGDETAEVAACREFAEETGQSEPPSLVKLTSTTTIPVVNIRGFLWGADILVVPEYAFGASVADTSVTLSAEHDAVAWLPFAEAHQRLRWDSNRSALWELNHRLTTDPFGRLG